MGNKGSFVFYTEYREHLSMLPPEQVGELMFALMDYQETGEVPDLPKGSALAMCFSFIKARMDKDNSKYEEKCERNKSNGKKGGRPTKETVISETEENPNKPNGFSENRTVISETEENPTEPQKADNDNEYDNDSDNEEYIHTPTKARACTHAEVEKPRKKSEPVKYSDVPELDEAIHEYIKFRKGIKSPMTDRAITLTINRLNSLSHDKNEQIKIINQSIMRGWKSVYPLEDDGKSRGQPRNVNPNGFANFKQTDHSEQLGQLEKMLADELNNK
ncbi:hypothetical protein DWX57_05350 [Coprococcus sp. AF19-8AC]|uniref:DUF6291 domain-containing protein n=1 Tax=Coprococcus sp. AF19-8AC TaxID=2293090 RepID=UPI000E7583BF|nr:DUF6291 domain-containing protein [Coprococcus sp. AF19-8AC]RJV45979.1 hypothetical protein DWX57_05350 [Coprococcus sp. AF19-8AC]